MLTVLYLGGPTAIIEAGGYRFMTDPTFDPAGSRYSLGGGAVNLEKSQGPAGTDIGKIDFVLLSHDQHPDNLDESGRTLLKSVAHTFT
jgi:L-ascorbate metabolism protein UlaG (beta-lactamase superfamily)